jgi:transposase
VQFHFNWKQLSIIAGLTLHSCCFRLFPGTIKSEQIVIFLKALRRQLQQRLLIIWDGLRAHRSRIVRLCGQHPGPAAAGLPAALCARAQPRRIPWAWLKRHALANFCPANMNVLQKTARNKLLSAQRRTTIIVACWKQASLF